jgi:hypothetical protein
VAVHLLAASPDWGTVPDWLAAVGTLAAFAVALRLLGKELAARRGAGGGPPPGAGPPGERLARR